MARKVGHEPLRKTHVSSVKVPGYKPPPSDDVKPSGKPPPAPPPKQAVAMPECEAAYIHGYKDGLAAACPDPPPCRVSYDGPPADCDWATQPCVETQCIEHDTLKEKDHEFWYAVYQALSILLHAIKRRHGIGRGVKGWRDALSIQELVWINQYCKDVCDRQTSGHSIADLIAKLAGLLDERID